MSDPLLLDAIDRILETKISQYTGAENSTFIVADNGELMNLYKDGSSFELNEINMENMDKCIISWFESPLLDADEVATTLDPIGPTF